MALIDTSHHDDAPRSFITRYVWSQDHKVIAVQYAGTAIAVGLVGLLLSNLMRLQIGFPGVFEFINAERYYQYVTMHGMIMVIYLLTALFLITIAWRRSSKLLAQRQAFASALQAEKERAQITLQAIGDAVITADVEGCIGYMNPAAEQLTHWQAGQAQGVFTAQQAVELAVTLALQVVQGFAQLRHAGFGRTFADQQDALEAQAKLPGFQP